MKCDEEEAGKERKNDTRITQIAVCEYIGTKKCKQHTNTCSHQFIHPHPCTLCLTSYLV